MRVILKPGLIALSADTQSERDELAQWSAGLRDHVFHLRPGGDRGAALHDLGVRAVACAEPINVTHDGDDRWRPISNLAHTPFDLDGRTYASIEGFWQGLKFPAPADRTRVAALWGKEAKEAGWEAPAADSILYEGERFAVGRQPHWRLMRRACQAKFSQHPEARAALLATGERPLLHRVRRDSQTIPGVVMADIWMQTRRLLAGSSSED